MSRCVCSGVSSLPSAASPGASVRGFCSSPGFGSGCSDGGFSPDFVQRPDGLTGLMRAYGEAIRPRTVRPLLPALKYQALAEGAVDVIDGYSTDGLLDRYNLVVLEDDRRFFPPYEAAALLGKRAAARADVVSALTLVSGKLGEQTMRTLNLRIEVETLRMKDQIAQVRGAGTVAGKLVCEAVLLFTMVDT